MSNDLLAAEPLIPSTMPAEKAASFGQQVSRARRSAEGAGPGLLLASDEASYMTGAVVPVTGGQPML